MRGLTRILIPIFVLTAVGVGWFRFVDGWSYVDSIYMTVITLSTVGYAEVHPLTDYDKLFVCLYLCVGLGVFLYGVVQIGESIVRAELGQWWRLRNMNQSIGALKGHFVICGGGRMGRLLCEALDEQSTPFVVIDRDKAVVESYLERGWNAICADATEDESLLQAGIERATGLAAALASDADNLYAVVTTRLLNSSIQVVARAHDEGSARKLKRAGANRVVSPYESGAIKMSQLLTNPRLNDFVEIISERNAAFDIVGLPVTTESPFNGQNLANTDLRARGVMIIAVRHIDGRVELAPSGETRLVAGDELFAIGATDAIRKLTASKDK